MDICDILSKYSRGYSSVGRAPALQAGGQEFESLYLHHDVAASLLVCRIFYKKNTASLYRLPLLCPAKPIGFCGRNIAPCGAFLPLLLLFREKSRLLRLCVCKRTHDAFTALSTFLGYAPSFLLNRPKQALVDYCACGANIYIV